MPFGTPGRSIVVVRQLAGYPEAARLARDHQLHTLGPALDHLVELGRERPALRDRAVEHHAVGRPAGVVHGDLAAGLRLHGARAGLQHLERQARPGLGRVGRRCGHIGRSRWAPGSRRAAPLPPSAVPSVFPAAPANASCSESQNRNLEPVVINAMPSLRPGTMMRPTCIGVVGDPERAGLVLGRFLRPERRGDLHQVVVGGVNGAAAGRDDFVREARGGLLSIRGRILHLRGERRRRRRLRQRGMGGTKRDRREDNEDDNTQPRHESSHSL